MTSKQQAPAALAGIQVVDLTTVLFGPCTTQALADYGADVVKIETPQGDSTRYIGPNLEPGMSAMFLGANRNKRSVVLDLKDPAARDALLALVDTADVFIHNVRPSALARLGLDAETMRARNPRLIFVGLHGFGEEGPYGGAPAYDDIIQALSGAADLVLRQTGSPGYFPTLAADKISGLVAVQAVLAALFQRERTGEGQVIEVPMFEVMTSFVLTEHFYARHLAVDAAAGTNDEMGYPRSLTASRRPYRTADGYACIMPYNDENWRRFFAATQKPDLASDVRFTTIAARTRHVEELLAITSEIVSTKTTEYWLALCRELDIPCARINRLEDLEIDPHLRAVGFFNEVPSCAGAPAYRFARFPVLMSRSAVAPAAPPHLGEHTEEVLSVLPLPSEVLHKLLARSNAAARRDPPHPDGAAQS